MAAFEALVPESVEQHFRLNHSRLSTYASMRTEVMLLIENRTASRLTAGDPMDVDSLQKHHGGGKGDKRGGKDKNKGKGKDKGEKDGKGQNQPVCYNCGRAGHKKSECW
eukprot:3806937-Amphidinium_carterae.1